MSIAGRYITMRGGNIIGTPPVIIPPSLLLDLYPATAAYSVRKLRTAYTGACMRVRRSSDNAEQDIGFSGNDLDTAALLSFVGAGNGFVTTWYDQSGNTDNFTQLTAANQPRIVNSGTLDIVGAFPQIRQLSANQCFTKSNSLTTGISMFAVYNLTTSSARTLLSEASNLDFLLLSQSGNSAASWQNVGTPTFYINSVLYTGGNNRGIIWTNANGFKTFSCEGLDFTGWTNFETERTASGVGGYDGLLELIFFDNSPIRTAIETNINAYYGIY
jgi:hypothetical protein